MNLDMKKKYRHKKRRLNALLEEVFSDVTTDSFVFILYPFKGKIFKHIMSIMTAPAAFIDCPRVCECKCV